jgi:nucleotide-binding universal stress UspA family protein
MLSQVVRRTEDRGRVPGVSSTSRRVVVGVDGSPTAREALRWAVELAGTTGAAVDVVGAWSHPANYEWTVRTTNYGLVPVPEFPAREHIEAAVLASLDEAVGGVADSAVPVTRRAVEGNPATVLVAAAADADLLVLGRRGHGRIVDLLLGSVSEHCIRHATCPVVVVPLPET